MVAGLCARAAGMVVLPVVLLLSLAIGLGYFRLLQGPVSVKFLVDPIQSGIATELTGLRPQIDDVVVAMTDSGGLEFRLQNLAVSETDGDLVISAPLAAMTLSPGALWSGQVVPARVELIEPRVFVSYSQAGGLQLRFSKPAGRGERLSNSRLGGAAPLQAPAPRLAQRPEPGDTAVFQRIDLARVIADASASARKGVGAGSFLREFGLRDANVILDYEGRSSIWQVPQLSIDLDHRSDRSVISGFANVASRSGPWSISFRTEDSEATELVSFTTSIRGLVPSALGDAVPNIPALRLFELPVDGDATVSVSSSGQILGADLALQIGTGYLNLREYAGAPLRIDAGLLKATYYASSQRLDIAPSTIRWGDSSLTLAGGLSPLDKAPGAEQAWRFGLSAQKGILGVSDFAGAPLAVDAWDMIGTLTPAVGQLKLDRFAVSAGGGDLVMSGEIDAGSPDPGSRFEGQIGALPLAALKALWPRAIAPSGRDWVGRQVTQGRITSGTMSFLSGRFLASEQPLGSEDEDEQRMTLAVEAADIITIPAEGLPPVSIPRALVRVENDDLEISMPEGEVLLDGGTVVQLKAGQYKAMDFYARNARGEVNFSIATDLPNALNLIRHPGIAGADRPSIDLAGATGNVDGRFVIRFPLLDDLSRADVQLNGTAKLSEGRAKNLLGGFDAEGSKIDFNISDRAVDARGELLLSGVLAKVNWQRIFGVPEDKQPPVRLTAVLDNADRKQLGIDASSSVLGEIPVEFTIDDITKEQPTVHLRADLTSADLLLRNIAWRKPPGRSAYLEGDFITGRRYPTELVNLTVVGDDIAIRGWAGFDKKRKLTAFEFPQFSLSLVSRLNLAGKLRKDKVWEIAVVGQTYDGRSFFRSLFSVGQISDQHPQVGSAQKGVDLTAKIDNVIGFDEVSLRKLDMSMSRRGDRMTALKARGTLDGGQPLAVELLEKAGEPRKLRADSTDAGQAFRLVGFYPNVQRGRVRLEVNLDGSGPAQKTGTLWVENFSILGDPVVADIVSSVDDGKPAIGGGNRARRQVGRQVIPFDRMRAPFSVGHGQFVLEDAYLRGPIQGATLRGKVDYNRRFLNIGGTYIPAQGLNNVFGEIPLLGDLLSGPRKEGIFGMTFAIQGPLQRPQVIVNPLSLVAPGIFREIFQLTPNAPRVQPRTGQNRATGGGPAVRSSSTPASGTIVTPGAGAGGYSEGWSSQTIPGGD